MDSDEPIVFEAPEVASAKKLTVAEQATRNMEIVAARGRGLSVTAVAQTYGISTRRVKQITAEWRATNPSIRHQDGVQIADQLIEFWQGTIEELAMIAATTSHDAVRVGAINSKMGALGKLTDLLQAINALPHDLGTLRVVMDARVLADRLVLVLDRFDLPPEVEDAMLEVLRPDDGEQKALAA